VIQILAIAAILITGAKTPHEAVQRFIGNRTPADACAQLTPAYQARLAKEFGPCVIAMRHQPEATRIRTSRERIAGAKATVDASFYANNLHFTERYTLIRLHGAWRITGGRQIP
jgi:hypothetical protein